MKLVKAMATVAGFGMISRISGMVRDIMMASFMGASPLSDAFFVALKLPNMFRRITAEGAFTVSFVPMYSKTIEVEGEEEAGKFTGRTFTMMSFVLSIFSVVMMIGMPWVIRVIAPGFEPGQERYEPSVIMTQVTFPYLLLMSLTAMFGGMLNVHQKFGPFSAAPVIFNFCNIGAMLIGQYLYPQPGQIIPYLMAWSVTLSGILQLIVMIYYIRKYHIAFTWQPLVWDPKIRKIFRLMGPGFISSGILQINIFIDTLFASKLAVGSISYLYFADRLQQLPLGIIGMAVGSALLPMLSRTIASGKTGESRDLFNRSLEYTYLIALPAAVALLIVPTPIIALLFEHGQFTRADSLTTSYVVMGYALGLPAYLAGKVFASIFWAQHDTMTPVKVSISNSVLNIVLCVCFIKPFGIAGIALATGLSGWLQLYLYNRRLKSVEIAQYDSQFQSVLPKIALSSAALALVLSLISFAMSGWIHGSLPHKLSVICILMVAGGITYAVAVWAFGIIKIDDIKKLMRNRKSGDLATDLADETDGV